MKRLIRVLLALALGGIFLVPAGPAAQAAPYCGIYWGSLAKTDPDMSGAPLVGIRTGRHTCYDRIVFDVRGDIRGYDVRYGTVRQEGSGFVVPLRGGADIGIVLRVPAYDANGNSTISLRTPTELSNVSGFRTFRQVAYAGSFEGQTTIGLGVRARLPFRVFILDGPGGNSRLVVDVAHLW